MIRGEKVISANGNNFFQMTSRDGTEGELNIFTESFPPLLFSSHGARYEVIDRARIASITNDVPCVFFHLHLKWLDEPFSESRRFERVGSILRNRFILAPFFTSRAMTGSVSDSRYSQRILELGARLAVTNSPILTFSVVKLQAKCESLLSLSPLSFAHFRVQISHFLLEIKAKIMQL